MKSPTPRIRRSDSPFTKEQEIWLVKRSASLGPTALRRAFIIQFLDKDEGYKKAPHPKAFSRLIERFDQTGGVTGKGKTKEQRMIAVTEENIHRVEEYFTENERKSIRDACHDLNLTFGTIWQILRRNLKWKAYRPLKVNRLTDRNKEDRLTFVRWLMEQPEEFEQKVIWSDEKWFVLHPAPNSQTDRIWAPWHPEEEVVCRFQGDSKVMAWVAIVDGKCLKVRWMVDEEGRNVSVTGDRYLSMIEEEVWPEVRRRAARNGYWWQQDGATSHTTNAILNFLLDKFRGRVISRRSEIVWPPYSPDLNVLDYFFWSYAMIHVRRRKPATIEELKETVEDVAATIPEEMIRDAVANVRKRCRACIEADGDHFESFLKQF